MLKSALVEVPVGLLKIGMYIAEVDRPWLETPFTTQGFNIESEEDIDFVAQHCQRVYVDPQAQQHQSITKPRFQPRPGKSHRSLRMTLTAAKADFESASVAMERVFGELRRNRTLNVSALQTAVEPLIKSVVTNGDALAALLRMREKADYYHEHAISTAVWSVILARHMGFNNDELRTLAMGAALIDVGMTNLPNQILNKTGELSAEETRLIQSHVRASVRIAEEAGISDHRIVEIISCHHERHSGAGYPKKIGGTDIPINARIVGIADAYDAMVTTRPQAPAMSSYDAIKELNHLAGAAFHPAVVSAFTQVVGLFPTGTLVELNTGEVAIVTGLNPLKRLQPEVLIILNADKEPYAKAITVNLAQQNTKDRNLSIELELAPGSYNIEPEYYFL